MEGTTTHNKTRPTGKTLRVLRAMPDWVIILLMILLALIVLGVSLVA
jgi:hypothetical protein